MHARTSSASKPALVLMSSLLFLGCGGDSNEREFFNSTKQGDSSEKDEHAGENVAARRDRTRAKSTPEKKFEKAQAKKADAPR